MVDPVAGGPVGAVGLLFEGPGLLQPAPRLIISVRMRIREIGEWCVKVKKVRTERFLAVISLH
jgi:hypothetical protein